MTKHTNPPRIPLPQGWPRRVKSAMLHVISLAQYSMAYTRGGAANSPIARVRLKAENERLKQQVPLLMEETASGSSCHCLRPNVAVVKPSPSAMCFDHSGPRFLTTSRLRLQDRRTPALPDAGNSP
ncbi:MAG: hypothetical protein V3W34_16645 [Phycisphaerae bacterium]